ncbi:MBL fold metallo-hydrolase [Haladaptatus sp. F3-133]|uniref:MBL fold metallo-hydrolase n=1 Tax=Halorutilus salinus TaxID=2487751 RepID=A0A9Q4C450_9EURY|nr:MBL fold metallo-hydrolase [Halorutilus salinus]MCX2818124.1 MBL fold metallo-hydrolase [Halorutilus salinus]
MHQIADGISMVDTRFLEHEGHTAVFIVEGRETALVETGHSTTRERVKNELAREGTVPDYIVPTHLHLDHAGATGYLADEYDATVVCHPSARDYLVEPEKVESLVESVRRAVGELAEPYGDAKSVEGEVRTLDDGETLDLGGRELEAGHFHGHAPHQFVLYDDETRSLFTADEAGMWMDGTLYQTSPPPNFDLETNLDSLDRLARYDAKRLVYTHFGARGDGEDDVREALEEYRDVLTDWVDRVETEYDRLGDEEEVVDEILAEAEFPDDWDETAVRETVRMDVRGVMIYLS